MFLKLATAIVAAAMVLRGVRTETHTVSFTNNCGFGTPYLWGPDGVLLSTGDDYTTNGPAPGLIAYLQCDDRCGNNGEGCTTVDATLTNEGNSVVEILNNSLNSVTTSIEKTTGFAIVVHPLVQAAHTTMSALSIRSTPSTTQTYLSAAPFQISSYFGASPMVAVNGIPMTPYSPISPEADAETTAVLARHRYRALLKLNEKRSWVTFVLLVFLAFAIFSVVGAVIGSAVISYVLAVPFKVGDFNMFTSVPPIDPTQYGLILFQTDRVSWRVLQTLVGLLGLWPSIVDIICQ
ncbi:uncharacterized protein FIBRA_04715 [Fibroporia radiculosa]|uniref:Uncharacterized protein n=1 Tax=Fibroporia radiculosa TaxID=599839 RepID=J4HWP3_9APHY|nr:uncharacterized protein FIBRA_04715 [Fibroporia radiculosa]CCM02612.1 predicted protein [Fibroporia radiculosa]